MTRATDARRRLRLVAETIGVVTAVGLHALAYIAFAAGAGLLDHAPQRRLYWASLVVAYASMLALACAGVGGSTRRQRLDAWLIAMVPALAATAWSIVEEWPVRVSVTSAHGFGPSGGEVNAAFLPWLHLLAWWAVRALHGAVRRA
jgi:hypothetical protein